MLNDYAYGPVPVFQVTPLYSAQKIRSKLRLMRMRKRRKNSMSRRCLQTTVTQSGHGKCQKKQHRTETQVNKPDRATNSVCLPYVEGTVENLQTISGRMV